MKFLNKLFNPTTIAVIGASRDPKKIGHQILANIIDGKFAGRAIPINLKEERILGLKAYPSVLKVPRKIDLAIIAIPAKIVPLVLKECGQKKIENVIIISAGFSEKGYQGKKLEEKLSQIAKNYQINLLGPNCLGIISPYHNLNASFTKSEILRGKLAVISQSGALGATILDWAKEKNIGFSYFASLGNKPIISEIDVLEHLARDPKTKLIFVYLEDTADGKKLTKIISKIKKPVVILKGGVTEKGQAAAASHTGAVATSAKIFKAGLKQSGAILSRSLEEAFGIISSLYYHQPPKGNKIAIITNAGGPAILATDEIAKTNLNLTKIEKETRENLAKILPPEVSLKNPIDILGDADAQRFYETTKILINDKNIDIILVILTPQTATEVTKTAEVISQISKWSSKFIATSFLGEREVQKAKEIFQKNNVANFDYSKKAIAVLEAICDTKKTTKITPAPIKKSLKNSIQKILTKRPVNFSFQVAKKFGLPIVGGEVIRSRTELNFVAKSTKFPVALKTLAKNVIHKKAAGGVILDIRTKKELKLAYQKLRKKFGPLTLLSPFIAEGFELYIGAKRDPLFGPVVLLGVGGIYVEGFNDVTARVFPIEKPEALKMISEIRAKKIIIGYGDFKGLNTKKIAALIIKTGELLYHFPEISEIDFNPVKATHENVKILDSRIVLK